MNLNHKNADGSWATNFFGPANPYADAFDIGTPELSQRFIGGGSINWSVFSTDHQSLQAQFIGGVDIAHVLFDASPNGRESNGALPAPADGAEDNHVPGWLHWPAHVVVASAHAGAHVALHPRDSLHRSRTLAGTPLWLLHALSPDAPGALQREV